MIDNSKIILDVDTGTDDAMAIIIAMCALKERLLGITVTHGNQPLPNTVENTLRVVELMGGGVPVYAGMHAPMTQKLTPGRMQNQRRQTSERVVDGKVVHIHDAYLPLPEAATKAEKQHAVSFIVEALREAEEPVTVVAVGPASNIGMALQMDPAIARNIKQLILMGGGDYNVNMTSAAEMNFYMDPEAAHLAVNAECPVVIFPLDATMSIVFREPDAEKISALGTPWAKFYGELIVDFIGRLRLLGISCSKDDPNDFAAAMHDAFCVLYLIDSSFVLESRRCNVDVDFGGSFCDGRMVVDHRSYIPVRGDVQVAYSLDKQKVMTMLLEILK